MSYNYNRTAASTPLATPVKKVEKAIDDEMKALRELEKAFGDYVVLRAKSENSWKGLRNALGPDWEYNSQIRDVMGGTLSQAMWAGTRGYPKMVLDLGNNIDEAVSKLRREAELCKRDLPNLSKLE